MSLKKKWIIVLVLALTGILLTGCSNTTENITSNVMAKNSRGLSQR